MTIDEIRASKQVYLFVEDFAEYFGTMSPQTLRVCIKSGKIPLGHVVTGKRLHVKRTDVLKYIENN